MGIYVVREGKAVTFVCIASGKPTPTLQIFHDGKEIDSADSSEILLHHIERVTPGHSGVYRCRAKNGHKDEESSQLIQFQVFCTYLFLITT